MDPVQFRRFQSRDRPVQPYIVGSSNRVTNGHDGDFSNLTIFGLTLVGTAVLLFIIWLLFRLCRCIRRRRNPQEHSRRHSQTFEHTVYQNHTRRASNYSFPLPIRIPTYQHPNHSPYQHQQSTSTRSPSRTGMPEMRSASRMSTFSNNSIAWPLTHQEQMRYVPSRSASYSHHRRSSHARRNRDDTSSMSSGATINKSPSPTSATPSEISVASTLVAVPLPAATTQYVGARAGWARNRPADEAVIR